MAYPISREALDLFNKLYRQVADISFYGLSEELHITDEDIILGGLSVNRYCVSGSKIEIGSVVASELELKLNNADGRFNSVLFEGAELYVRVGTKKWDARRWENAKYHYVPFGYFTVDEAPRKLEIITLKALDRMVLFDKTVDMNLLSFPMTVNDLLIRICNICNVPLGTNISILPNHSYVINEAPVSDDLTYRQLLSWIAELTGTCGFIDWNGYLILKWYEQTDTTLTVKDRFNSDIEENAIVITGVQIVAEEEIYLEGDDGYAFNIESNELIQHDYREVAQALYSVLGGFSYTPFSASVKPMPHLYPLDMIVFVDKNGINRTTIITDYTFTLNANTDLEGKGETATRSGYALANPLTKRESAIISNLKKEQNKTLNSRIQAVLALNETIANSLGLYETAIEQANGSIITYYHNEPSLEESSIIYVRNAGGFAWTHDWNNGAPVWEYGFTQDGNAVYNALSAWKIQTQYLDAECVRAENISMEYRQSVQNNINTSAKELQQDFTARFGELRSSITETLKNYSTTEETNSLIRQTADSIALSVSKTLNDYSTTQQMQSAITQTSDSIMLEVNKKVNDSEFGTKITQNYSSVRIAWNSISKYIEFAGGELNIYESAAQGSDNLLMKLNSTGAWYYNRGATIGKIGTNRWSGDDSFRGLVFDLESEADYMCWAHRETASADVYTVKLIYYANDRREKEGLHFDCATYCSGNLYINDYVRTVDYSDGSGGLYSENRSVVIRGSGGSFTCGSGFTFGNSTNKLVDCYNNIDLHNYSILNQSDARYKKNIEPTSIDAISALSAIELKSFDWIESGEHSNIGFIAQQLQEVIPDLVDENKQTGRLSVKTDKLIPYLVKAVQELSSIVSNGAIASERSVFVSSALRTNNISETISEWTDTYTDEEKRQFIAYNQPQPEPETVESKPVMIPISHATIKEVDER
ncbi:MAG: tail fiber domain-containing protein [Oscillospiraceae bacterium]|nr:tail fiber domain-containing protein [Oscillospiraceae bacterium]